MRKYFAAGTAGHGFRRNPEIFPGGKLQSLEFLSYLYEIHGRINFDRVKSTENQSRGGKDSAGPRRVLKRARLIRTADRRPQPEVDP